MSRIEDNYSPGVVSDARRLPDSDFYDHPTIAPLKAQIDELESAHRDALERLQAHLRTVDTLKVRHAELIEQETVVLSSLPDLAAADLAAGDLDFTQATDGRERCQRLAWQAEAAEDGLKLAEARTAELQRPARFAADRQQDLNVRMQELIWPLKLQAAQRARG